MLKVLNFLSPIRRLGNRKYSLFFPLILTTLAYVSLELFAAIVLSDRNALGSSIILLSFILIVYTACRDGRRGGFIATGVTIAYYVYLMYARGYVGDRLNTAVEATAYLGILYLLCAFIIGWLKEKIDYLLGREADEKKRLQTILQQLPAGVIITDREGVILESNAAVQTLLGISLPIGAQLVQSNQRVVLSPEYEVLAESTLPILEAIVTGKKLSQEEFVIENEGAQVRYIHAHISSIQNGADEPIATATILTDITQQKELEQLKDEFIGIASHELKTPLTSIKGYTQILERIIEEMGSDKARLYLRRTNRYIDKLTSLIGDLLDVSKIQAGKLEFTSETYNFDTMIQEAIDSFAHLAKKYTIIKRGDSIPAIVGDSSRTEQVINNFLSNAIKYSPDADTIIVTVERKRKMAVVSVQDFGIGISPEKKEHIFKRFYRINQESKKFSGLGIGLYISSEIVERQGGKIWVDSSKGVGSTFYFSLPLVASITDVLEGGA